MKVLFIARASLYSNRGGDTIQILGTAKYLQKLGTSVDIRLTNEKIDYSPYDLLHFFNVIRPADILHHCKLSGKPYAVSTIYVDYSEYDKTVRKGISGTLFNLLPKGFIEYAKVIARAIVNGERIVSSEYLWLGHKKAIRKVIKGASLLLPNSISEYKRLSSDLKIEHPFVVIPNAIDMDIFSANTASEKEDDLVLCVGRIEGLKNQLNLVRALNHTKYRLMIIGKAATNQKKYYEQCLSEAEGNVSFAGSLTQEELVKYYSRAKVHVLPSWFETTGLSSLEAAAMGCNVVITDKGDAKEYFGNMAYYCDPSSPESIRKAIDEAISCPVNPALREKVCTEFNWQVAAEKTLEAYNRILEKS